MVPKHIGIILDGNRRFSKKLMMKPWKGHEWGARKVEKLLDWSKELGIKELTLYAFSVENFNRPKDEFNYLMGLFRAEFKKLLDGKRLETENIRMNFIGRIWMFPKDIQESMKKIMDLTAKNKDHIVNFAMAYGGQAEIIDAVRKIADQLEKGELNIDKINEETFKDYLYMSDGPDLIIRTGGERRTSNFLNYQSAYSEWVFLEKTWPEFEKEDLVNCIQDFNKRDRRFGH